MMRSDNRHQLSKYILNPAHSVSNFPALIVAFAIPCGEKEQDQ